MNSKTIKSGIRLLKQIANNPACQRMSRSTVIGYLGELWILYLLTLAQKEPKHHGKQSGFDIKALGHKIDVKTSTLKQENESTPLHWGWALDHENKKREPSCTKYLCVALDKDLEPSALYLIDKNNLKQFPKSPFGQFGGVKHSFSVPENAKSLKGSLRQYLEYSEKCKKCIGNGLVVKMKAEARTLAKELAK
jgi:hypothetical protein